MPTKSLQGHGEILLVPPSSWFWMEEVDSSLDTAGSIISVTRCCCRLHILFLGGMLCMTIQEAVGAKFNRSSFLPVRTRPSQFPLLRSGPF
ncbi:hypothetical protein DPMN_018506 [Dreissena polymorpha]|uniref:Uncharacterized protein n=1 Tax=Dreissena polymorpha TaxID=45954 RepID=A0A9D4NF94_DREPO|nr:hypothetical protein DPMN_018506 [Dreissena polymorpha]